MAVASGAFACVALASLELTDTTVSPGQQVSFSGAYYNDTHTVSLHWASADGPVLATLPPAGLTDFGHSFWREIAGSLTVPSDAEPGHYVVVATQADAAGKPIWGVPARAAIEVVVPGQTPATREPPEQAEAGRLTRLQVTAPESDLPKLVLVAMAMAALGAIIVTRTRAVAPSARLWRTPR
ncbi:MAG TPA: hypothetical protein VM142_15410 [Acidimicrobiales bacterium]|nr:hypothetical protein [Acidimicrobiales bacterium]